MFKTMTANSQSMNANAAASVSAFACPAMESVLLPVLDAAIAGSIFVLAEILMKLRVILDVLLLPPSGRPFLYRASF